MAEGAFALLDCLGFKGIWKRGTTSAAQIIGSLEAIQNGVKTWPISDIVATLGPDKFDFRIAFISDTIAISAIPRPTAALSDAEKGYLVVIVMMACGEAIKRFLLVPSALRGCITYGEHTVSGNFLVGQAVDEAAELYEQAQAALIWLTPAALRRYATYRAFLSQELPKRIASTSAEELVVNAKIALAAINKVAGGIDLSAWDRLSAAEALQAAHFIHTLLVQSAEFEICVSNYSVPLKSGGYVAASVVNPFIMMPEHEIGPTGRIILSTFNEASLDVIVKRQQTERVLLTCLKARQTYLQNLQKFASEMNRLATEQPQLKEFSAAPSAPALQSSPPAEKK